MPDSPIPSPFHRGERDVQTRLGVREQIEDIGQRFIKENTYVRPVIESGLLEELIDQFCDLLRRVLMAVVANAL